MATFGEAARESGKALRRGARPRLLGTVLEAARPAQWLKNLVVFAPLLFGRELGAPAALPRVGAAALLFCLLTSAVYLCNDACDAESDLRHPLKRRRPVASGRLPRRLALRLSLGLGAGAVLAGLALAPALGGVLAAYALLMVGYSLWLKHVVIVDVLAIAAGFVLRAAAGAVVIGVPLSGWLYLCTVLLSLFLGFGKRRHELALLDDAAPAHRPNLEHYSLPMLDQLIAVTAAATLVAYALYSLSAPNLPESHAMLLTLPFVLYGLFRYLYLIYAEGRGGAPDHLLLADRPLLAAVLLWALCATAVLYLA